jgi:hypothetical protein
MAWKAFIVRPFGSKGGIDFEEVQKQLIAPALAANAIQGGTTAPFLQAGNIRADMFQQLLVADFVIADVSIHNANVFYELGIRHALQPLRTYLIRAKNKKDRKDRGPEDEVPFDIKTDRYLEYDSDDLKATLAALIDGIRQTLASEKADSPVFQMLPDLEAQERSRFLPVPQGFRDDVERAVKARQVGLLGLLAVEALQFFWASEGLRLAGRAQIDLKAFVQAKDTWEELFQANPGDIETNQRLGTIYQRLGDLDASNQALARVLANKRATSSDRAEALALIGRNVKDHWRSTWSALQGDDAATTALQSPELMKAIDKYTRGFQEDLNSFYAGLNALSLLTIAVELGRRFPEVWEARFNSADEAKADLDRLQSQRQTLSGAVSVALDAAKQRLVQQAKTDVWYDISVADFQFLTNSKPAKVAFAYQSALDGVPDFNSDSVRAQLLMFQQLGVLPDNAKSALALFPATPAKPATAAPGRVILFTGHMIDEPGRQEPRFPNSLTPAVRDAIRAAVQQEVARTDGAVIGIASGASGGDLLFHDVCGELGIDHRLYIPLPSDTFRNESVLPAGRDWQDRFDKLCKQCQPLHVMATSADLPLWLAAKADYTCWQRANLWLIHESLALGAKSFTLLALWDGVKTEGLGGTFNMTAVAQQHGAAIVPIQIADLLKANPVPDNPKT